MSPYPYIMTPLGLKYTLYLHAMFSISSFHVSIPYMSPMSYCPHYVPLCPVVLSMSIPMLPKSPHMAILCLYVYPMAPYHLAYVPQYPPYPYYFPNVPVLCDHVLHMIT